MLDIKKRQCKQLDLKYIGIQFTVKIKTKKKYIYIYWRIFLSIPYHAYPQTNSGHQPQRAKKMKPWRMWQKLYGSKKCWDTLHKIRQCSTGSKIKIYNLNTGTGRLLQQQITSTVYVHVQFRLKVLGNIKKCTTGTSLGHLISNKANNSSTGYRYCAIHRLLNFAYIHKERNK
jgi:hypothetical protein